MAAPSSGDLVVGEESVSQLPTKGDGTTQNGPSRWDRPWSVQEIHAEAGHWSLAGDAGLLQHLQEFSHRIISNTHQIGKEVDGLVHESKLLDVRVNNVINDFIMLANNQFVENRVYDEDISEEPNTKEEKKIEQEKTKEQREAELIPRVAFALKLGVDVIENAFEKLDPRVVDSDSEDEDNSSYLAEPILEAKDPYVTRPLPFLIGTPQFMEDDNVGLLEELSDEEAESDHGSISVSDDEDRESEGSEYSASEESEGAGRRKITEKKQRTGTISSTASDLSEDDSDKDMFLANEPQSQKSSGDAHDNAGSGDISASEDEDLEEKLAPPTGGPKDFNAELAARLRIGASKQADEKLESGKEDGGWKEKSTEHKSKNSLSSSIYQKDIQKGKDKQTVEDRTDNMKSTEKLSKHGEEGDNLFGHDDRHEEDDLFSKDVGMFSSSKGLFDDDNEEGDLFKGVQKPTAKMQKPNEKVDSMFSGDFETEDIKEQKVPDTLSRMKGGGLLTKSGLPTFVTGQEKISSQTPESSSATHTVKKPTAQPAGAPSKAAGGQKGGGGLFDDESEEEDDLFSTVSKNATVVKNGSASTLKKTAAPVMKKSDLFMDEDDDDKDLFGSMAASGAKKKPHSSIGLTVEGYDEGEKVEEKKLQDEKLKKIATPEKKLPPGAVSMFGGSPNPLVAALKQHHPTPSSDEEDKLSWSENDRNSLNSSIHSTSSATLPPSLKAVEGTKSNGSSSSQASSILTDTRGDDDLFTPKTKSESKTSVAADRNRNHSKAKIPELDHKKPGKIKSVKDSLFDSSGDDGDGADIFSTAVKHVDSRRSGKNVSLFGDEDVGESKAETDMPNKQASNSANKLIGGSLFDDHEEEVLEEEPLFSVRPPLQTADRTNTTKSKAHSLFASDDLLFPSAQDEDPSVDLFSRTAPLAGPSQEKGVSKQSSSAPAKAVTPTNKPIVSSLFSGDDDDDLFVTKPVTVPSPTSSTIKTTAEVVGTQSTNTIETKIAVKPDVMERKKPAGFRHVDPPTMQKKENLTLGSHEEGPKKEAVKVDEKEVRKEEQKSLGRDNTSAKAAVTKQPKPVTDLFGVDDNEDLFSPKTVDASKEPAVTPDKEVTAASKPESPTKLKIPAGAVSMFGGVDPSGLKKNKVIEQQEEKKEQGTEKEKVLPPQPAPKPKSLQKEKPEISIKPKSLHGTGLFEDDAEDSKDLFGVTKKKAAPPPTAPKSQPPILVSSEGVTEGWKFEGVSRLPETAGPKTPAGAVPMFGGINLFSGMKKAPILSENNDSREISPKKPLLNDPLFVLASPVTMATALTKPASPGTVEEFSADEATYAGHVENGSSVDFEQSMETETLTSANKDRPKINRRRPQSRKARIQAAAHTDISSEDAISSTPETPRISGYLASSIEATPQTSHVNYLSDSKEVRSKPKSGDLLFGNDDLLEGLTLPSVKPQTIETIRTSSQDALFSKDLIHENRTKLFNGAAEDLTSGLSRYEVIAVMGSETTPVRSGVDKNNMANINDQQDGLFSGLSKREAIAVTRPEIVAVQSGVDNSKTNDLTSVQDPGNVHTVPFIVTGNKTKLTIDLDDDNLFSSSAKTSTAKSKPVIEEHKDDNLFSPFKSSLIKEDNFAQSKETDIFGSPSLSIQKDMKRKPGADSATTQQEDIMGSKKLEDAKNTKPKKAVAREDNLLSDTTDIFSDIPAPTPREPKKRTPKKVQEKNVFKGDIDDIFADTSAATIKPRKDNKKKTTKSTAAVSGYIFDDPLS